MGRMDGKVAIVTGGAMGLGEADATLMAREGARVIVTDVNRERGASVAAAIGGEYRFHDVANEGQWVELIADVMKKYGALHVLVNNAGIVEPGNIETQTYDEYRRQMDVSAGGTFLGCKYAVPAMAKSGSGSIINMASIASKRGVHNVTAYCAAKGAVEALIARGGRALPRREEQRALQFDSPRQHRYADGARHRTEAGRRGSGGTAGAEHAAAGATTSR